MSETTQPIPLTDLRIGNYVTHPQNPIIKIRSFTSDIITYYIDEDKYSWTHPDFISGIPLTEEWLKKLNIPVYDKEKKIYIIDKYVIAWTDSHNLEPIIPTWILNLSNNSRRHVEIKYIHQLQNIIYFLIGKELTIK